MFLQLVFFVTMDKKLTTISSSSVNTLRLSGSLSQAQSVPTPHLIYIQLQLGFFMGPDTVKRKPPLCSSSFCNQQSISYGAREMLGFSPLATPLAALRVTLDRLIRDRLLSVPVRSASASSLLQFYFSCTRPP